MGRYLYKVGDDKYIEFSTVIDAPTTYVCTREEMGECLAESIRAWHAQRAESEIDQIDERLDRADEHFCTYRIPGHRFASADEALQDLIDTYNLNRPEEDQLTTETFWKEYTL